MNRLVRNIARWLFISGGFYFLIRGGNAIFDSSPSPVPAQIPLAIGTVFAIYIALVWWLTAPALPRRLRAFLRDITS